MLNFQLSRIAVNLSLIVAMSIQPVAFCWAGMGCAVAAKLADGEACQGCGCCEVAEIGKRRGCCQSESSTGSTEVFDGDVRVDRCCMVPQMDSPPEQPLESKFDAAVTRKASSASEPVNRDERFRPVCRCRLEPLPLGDSTPSRGTNDVRNQPVLFAIDTSGQHRDDGRLPQQPKLHSIKVVLPPHFSQLLLCIWRL